MAHKTTIDGAGYSLQGGRVLVGGAGYDIIKGRTLIGGAGYDVLFQRDWRTEFVGLMRRATLERSDGTDNRTGEYALMTYGSDYSLTLQAGTYYVIAIYAGKVGIAKVYWSGAAFTSIETLFTNEYSSRIEPVFQASSNVLYAKYYQKSNQNYYNVEVSGGGVFVFTFPGVSQTAADNILSGFTAQSETHREAYTKSYVYVADTTQNALLVQYSEYVGLSFPYGTVIFGNHYNNPSLLRHNNSRYYLSENGTSNKDVYGATIIEL